MTLSIYHARQSFFASKLASAGHHGKEGVSGGGMKMASVQFHTGFLRDGDSLLRFTRWVEIKFRYRNLSFGEKF